ncbi:MAG: hypothetical protein IPP52_11485 [Ignavibacteria bacterium]|nr:hypothetical protein [Ignavibacteria bacterium]
MCNGSGHIQSKSTFLNRIERWITRYKGGNNGMSLTLTVNPYQALSQRGIHQQVHTASL